MLLVLWLLVAGLAVLCRCLWVGVLGLPLVTSDSVVRNICEAEGIEALSYAELMKAVESST